MSLANHAGPVPDQSVRPAGMLLQLVCFVLVGGVAALSYALLTAALIELRTGVPDWVLGTLCYGAFIVPVYLAHRQVSFRTGTPHRIALPRYAVVQAAALVLAAAFSHLAYGLFGLASLPGAMLVIALTSGVNFIVLKAWAFAADA